MKFEDWFDEIENFSLRSERFFEDLNDYDPGINPEIVIKWLRAAYEAGKEHKSREGTASVFHHLDWNE